MTLPSEITGALETFGPRCVQVAEGRWEIALELMAPSGLKFYWDLQSLNIQKVGGALISEPLTLAPSGVPGEEVKQFTLLYPAEHGVMRTLFDKWDFGWDDFAFAETGKHPLPETNHPSLVAKRKAAALAIFDAMAEDGPVILTRMMNASCTVRFFPVLPRERADYWADVVWKFRVQHYGMDAGAEDEDSGMSFSTRKEVLRLARKFGTYILGGE
jgi:hypothetical protein